ncbi:hypothetical protein A2U01_0082246, partial [Trifolium medium]|nr:hypothetical protein [Trifolium medium]
MIEPKLPRNSGDLKEAEKRSNKTATETPMSIRTTVVRM